MRGVPCIYDLDVRFRIMDEFGDYRQMISLGMPPLEALGEPAETEELARLGNDGMAELVARHPDRFAGFVASLPMNDSRGGRPRGRARLHGARRQRAADTLQRQRSAARRATLFAGLRDGREARQAGADASLARLQHAGLSPPRRARNTRSGGPSAGPTRPAPQWRGSSSPASWTGCPNSRSLAHHLGAMIPFSKAASGRVGTSSASAHPTRI